jgi:hypothetical protein
MDRLRTLAAVLAGLALVAVLPAPCACPPETDASRAADHSCCAPPVGVSADDHGCCDEDASVTEAVPSPAGADAAVPSLAALRTAAVPATARVFGRSAVPAPSPPIPLVLRI